MARTVFFATRADMEPGLRAIEAMKELRYARCRAGNSLDGPHLPVYRSLLDVTDFGIAVSEDKFDNFQYLIVEPDTPLNIEAKIYGTALPVGGDTRYNIDISLDPMRLAFEPGGIYKERFLYRADIGTIDLTPETAALYRLFSRTLTADFTKIGEELYGPQALALGAAGIEYTWDLQSANPTCSFQEVEQIRQHQKRIDAVARTSRLSLEATWELLEMANYGPLWDEGHQPLVPTQALTEDTEEEDFTFFRTFLREANLSRMTLPRTYFGRTGFELVSFLDSDLKQSYMCENDWLDCDFTAADLSETDMSSSLYYGCRFKRAILNDADLREAEFVDCDFTEAEMRGAVLSHEQADIFLWSERQRAAIDWQK